MFDLTAHILVRDEEIHIGETISSILPIVKKIIIIDTGSVDSTIDIIKSFKSPKITFIQEAISSKSELIRVRNKMVKLTKTEWFIICDADEIIDSEKLAKIFVPEEIAPNINRVTVPRVDFFWNHNLIGPKAWIGKLFRAQKVHFVGDYPTEIILNLDGTIPEWVNIGDDIIFYHFTNLKRSHRRTPGNLRLSQNLRFIKSFPIRLFFGPIPSKTIKPQPNLTPTLAAQFVVANILGFYYRASTFASRRIKKIFSL